MAGHDPLDPGSADVPVQDYIAGLQSGVSGLRIGYVANWFEHGEEGMDPEVAAALHAALDVFRHQGALVEELNLPDYSLFHACGRMIVLSECYSIHQHDLIAYPELYGRPTRERLMAGAFVRGCDYVSALRLRRVLADEVNTDILGQYDVLIAPVSGTVAPRFDETPDDPMKLGGMATAPFNVTGSPAMSVCIGLSADGLPMSMQIAGKPFDEAMVFRVGAAFERATDFRSQRPSLSLS